MPFIRQGAQFRFAALEVLTGEEHAAQGVDQAGNVEAVVMGIGGRI